MGVVSYRGVDYSNKGPRIQNISEADYAALEQAGTIDPNTVYFRYELEDFGFNVQDDGTATTLLGGKVPTGRTIESYLENKIQDDSTATDLNNTKLPTGQTIESWLLKRLTPVKLGVKTPATADTWDTMYLSESISNYAMLWFRAVQYGNTLAGTSEPVALFKTHTGTGNRIIWMYGSSMTWQAYYVNDTQIAVVQSTVSGNIYQTEVWGFGRLV